MRNSLATMLLTAALLVCLSAGSTFAVELHPILRSDLRPVTCQKLLTSKNLMVAIVFGQSNSANFGEKPGASKDDAYMFFDGICFHAKDPMPGANGDGGSVWTRLGDMLIDEGMYDTVLFVPLGIGGTRMSEWAPGGRFHGRVIGAIAKLRLEGFEPTHMLWHQGESDYATPGEIYKAEFRAMLGNIRAQGVDAPIFVSVATWYNNIINQEIEQAQRELVNPEADIFAGPDTDRLGIPYRYDGSHFNEAGLTRFAELWVEALRNAEPPPDD